MLRDILIPIDGSDHSYGGLVYALQTFPDGRFTTLVAINPTEQYFDESAPPQTWRRRAEERAEKYQQTASELAEEFDDSITTEIVSGRPHKAILEYAVDERVDHICIGSHGRSPIQGAFLGHVTETVARRAPCSVTIVPTGVDELTESDIGNDIVVPIDGSERSLAALQYAFRRFPDGTITALTVVDLPVDLSHEESKGTYIEELLSGRYDRADETLATARDLAETRDRQLETDTAVGDPTNEIIRYALDHDADQIVLGSYGRSGLPRVLLGSVAEGVAHRAPVPVTIVREAFDH